MTDEKPGGDVYEVDEAAEAGEQTAATATATAEAPAERKHEPPFTEDEIRQFDADDVAAGSHIGKMLALFFLYTVIAMAFVVWWTVRAVAQ